MTGPPVTGPGAGPRACLSAIIGPHGMHTGQFPTAYRTPFLVHQLGYGIPADGGGLSGLNFCTRNDF